jgi:hypothetical protein
VNLRGKAAYRHETLGRQLLSKALRAALDLSRKLRALGIKDSDGGGRVTGCGTEN